MNASPMRRLVFGGGLALNSIEGLLPGCVHVACEAEALCACLAKPTPRPTPSAMAKTANTVATAQMALFRIHQRAAISTQKRLKESKKDGITIYFK
jgi:hypothetical protein